jgi:Fic/DOC family
MRISGHFDTAHFREIHRYLFQDVYDWAGEYRTVEFSKGSSAFAPLKTPAHTLESWGEKILGDLATENHLKGLKKAAFAERQSSGDDARLALDVFNKITTPSRAIAFRDEHILDAVKRFPELQGAADALAAAKRKSDAEYDAGTARLFWRRSRRSCSSA